MVTGQQNVNKL